MNGTLAAPRPTGASASELADNLIRLTDRLSSLMDHEIELLRGRRARDIKALQSDKETLTAVYQRMMSDLKAQPSALSGLDDGRKSALRRAAARLENAASGNAIALRTAIEANHRLMEAIAGAIRERNAETSPYAANGQMATSRGAPLTMSVNQTF